MNIQDWLGKDNELGIQIWKDKYQFEDESFDEWLDRVSNGNKEVKELIKEKKFLFGGRILANRGLDKLGRKVTYSNCYVLEKVPDSIEGIYETAKQLARTFSYGGGVGIDISNLRPKGSAVNNAAKTTTGAVSFMETFSNVSSVIGQEGRRGALMISMDCNHPDIEDFIDAKKNTDKLEGCNISVRVDDEFMEKVLDKETLQYKLFMKLAENNWDYAEPGILYWDTINNYNLLSEYIKHNEFEFAGVNPCVVGDTVIQTTDGPIAIKDLVGKTPDVLCMDKEGKLVIKKAIKVWKTRENAELVKVVHHRGELICTPDHLIYTRNRGWVKAIDLQPKDRLNGLGISMNSERHCSFKLTSDDKYYPAHRFILGHYVNIKGKDVHHLDDNPLNNSRQNLVALSHSIHSQITNKGHECYANRDEVTGRFIEGKTGGRSENLEVNKDVKGKNFIVKEVVKLDYREDVYDMTVEDEHNFIANNIVIHNCAEEPLPAGGSCLLGAINLAEYVENPYTDKAAFNLAEFRMDVKKCIRALNEVLDEGLSLHPLEIQQESVNDWRQIGLGIMGFGTMLIKMKVQYGSERCLKIIQTIGTGLVDSGLLASSEIAEKLGVFPMYDEDRILESNFIQNLPISQAILNHIKDHGLRNSQLFTIAPTGSISTMLQVTGGVEPMFNYKYWRKTKSLNGGEDTYYEVIDPVVLEAMKHEENKEQIPEYVVWAGILNPEYRVLTQGQWQRFIDASISSTVNLNNEATIEEVAKLYHQAWVAGCKGLTIFRDGCARIPILSTNKEEAEQEEEVKEIDTSIEKCTAKGTKLQTGCGSLWVTAYFHNETGQLCHIFLDKGSTGGCNSFMVGLSRMISLLAKKGTSVEEIAEQLKSSVACPSYIVRSKMMKDTSPGTCCPGAIANALLKLKKEFEEEKHYAKEEVKEEVKQNISKCPECGEPMASTGGCNICLNCGYSKCM